MTEYDPNDLTRNFRTKITVCDGCGCWVFSRTDRYGYPSFKLNGKNLVGHRYAYTKLVGDIPDGYDLDHLCDRTRACVNPAHIEPVPKSENAVRANQRRWHGSDVRACDDCAVCVLNPAPITDPLSKFDKADRPSEKP